MGQMTGERNDRPREIAVMHELGVNDAAAFYGSEYKGILAGRVCGFMCHPWRAIHATYTGYTGV